MPTLTATEIKTRVTELVEEHKDAAPDASSQWALVKAIESLWPDLPVKVRKANRYTVCQYLVGVASTKDMTQAQIEALLDWVTRRQVGGDTTPVLGEATRVLDAVMEAEGQVELPKVCKECEMLARDLRDLEVELETAINYGYSDTETRRGLATIQTLTRHHQRTCPVFANKMRRGEAEMKRELGY